mmetsp:Transcript_1848/g.2032  ORF Transcript_1848/g.2032 Transcript_1848/m.2032 type:complete len:179 (-) Transcript_1848:438-974(-)
MSKAAVVGLGAIAVAGAAALGVYLIEVKKSRDKQYFEANLPQNNNYPELAIPEDLVTYVTVYGKQQRQINIELFYSKAQEVLKRTVHNPPKFAHPAEREETTRLLICLLRNFEMFKADFDLTTWQMCATVGELYSAAFYLDLAMARDLTKDDRTMWQKISRQVDFFSIHNATKKKLRN